MLRYNGLSVPGNPVPVPVSVDSAVFFSGSTCNSNLYINVRV